jgi:hypothetical protein
MSAATEEAGGKTLLLMVDDRKEHGSTTVVRQTMVQFALNGRGAFFCAQGRFPGPPGRQTNALIPVTALPTIRFCIWNVPSNV